MIEVLRLPRSLLNLKDARRPVEVDLVSIHEVIQIVALPLLVQSFVRPPAVPSGLDFFRIFPSFSFRSVLQYLRVRCPSTNTLHLNSCLCDALLVGHELSQMGCTWWPNY